MIEICYICGHKGFSNALLDCSKCSASSVHQYCLGIAPGSIDHTFNWVCESCSTPTEGGSEIAALPEEPEPLCMLLPAQYHGSSTREKTSNLSQKHEPSISSFMEHPDSIMQGLVLLVNPSGEVFVDEENSFSDILNMSRPAKFERDTEGPSSEPVGISKKKKRKLIKQKSNKFKVKFNSNKKLSFGSVSYRKQLVRDEIVTMLLSAGWTIEHRPRMDGGSAKYYKVYVSPQGKVHWSVPNAYRSLEKDVRAKARAMKSKVGDDSGNSNFCFKPVPEKLLSVLNRRSQVSR
ncbi:unnamed protein product [Amaranthus hypochondriacus]